MAPRGIDSAVKPKPANLGDMGVAQDLLGYRRAGPAGGAQMLRGTTGGGWWLYYCTGTVTRRCTTRLVQRVDSRSYAIVNLIVNLGRPRRVARRRGPSGHPKRTWRVGVGSSAEARQAPRATRDGGALLTYSAQRDA